jgi:hypothetical protein
LLQPSPAAWSPGISPGSTDSTPLPLPQAAARKMNKLPWLSAWGQKIGRRVSHHLNRRPAIYLTKMSYFLSGQCLQEVKIRIKNIQEIISKNVEAF